MARKAKSAPAPPAGPEPLPPELLETVARAPGDDVPRLVAADWFAEHGQPERAELIDLQCRLERLEPASPERERLEEAVLATLRKATALRSPSVGKVGITFVRGFPCHLLAEPADLVAAEPELLALAPPVERLTLTSLTDLRALQKLTATELWSRIRELHLWTPDDRAIQLLLDGGAFARLDSLTLADAFDLDRHAWRALGRSDALKALRALRLQRANAGPWCRASPSLPRLELLHLEDPGMKPQDLKALSRSDIWPQLQTLVVSMGPLASDGAGVFPAAPPRALRALDLSWCRLGAAGLRALCRTEGMPLRILKLRHDGLAGAALEPLLDAPLAQALEWLDVRGNAVDPATLKKLRARWAARLLA